ncbi:DUF6503 family protein [Lewinella sp. JB7]|uniref:DUF6503 family protein n=1 Tax=Lewinella sp. JB7 TaxID=2962887 RepID=UPI0020C9EB4D|nr:DUF6503 family protein [Lewinella sp. JB7]MCP9234704.1 DUF6503 family protein [Lewinella sp. JB7]
MSTFLPCYLIILLLFGCQSGDGASGGPPTTASEVLDRAIAHHDPGGNWTTFDAAFLLNSDTIVIDLPESYFAQIGGGKYFVADRDVCRSTDLGDDSPPLASDSCANVIRKRDYHTYLNGLPMKLRDPGTPLEDDFVTTEFHGKEYLRLRVNYPKSGGTVETWEFFFDPATYALGAYQFYRSDNPQGGEYLLLDGEIEIGGVRMVETKEWYLRENDELLGSDIVGGEVVGVRF